MNKERYSELLQTPEWAKKRAKILKRDKETCQKCGCKNKGLHVHHRYYLSGFMPWEYPDEALVTLCRICHEKEHENKPIEDFTKKKSKGDGFIINANGNKNKKHNCRNQSKKQGHTKKYKKDKPLTAKDSSMARRKDRFQEKTKRMEQKRKERRMESDIYNLPEYKHLRESE